MKLLGSGGLLVIFIPVLMTPPQLAFSQAPPGKRVDNQGVEQGPPFPVPEAGYEIEGRPALFLSHYNLTSIAWNSFDPSGMPAGLQRRVLSQSPSMDAVSQITYVPAGWSHSPGYHGVDMEMFILEGDLSISDDASEDKLTKYSYSYMPAGVMHELRSRQGAVLIQWWKGAPDFVAVAHDQEGARKYSRIRNSNHFHTAWYVGEPFPAYRVGGNFPGMIHKLLRQDPDTGEMTWMSLIVSIPAPPSGKGGNFFGGSYEVHPSFEEYFFPEKSHDSFIDECLEQGPATVKYGDRTYWWRAGGVGHGGPASLNVDTAGHSFAIVRTGTRLWATYVTDCSYKTGFKYVGSGSETYKYVRDPHEQE